MNRVIKFRFWDLLDCKMWNDIDLEEHTLHSIRDWEGDLMQFIGLKDKNGNEIYEGDIVVLTDTESEYVDVGIGVLYKVAETKLGTIAKVVFFNGAYGFDIPKKSELWDKGFNSIHQNDYVGCNCELDELLQSIEIIGNIYENPELLK